MGVEMVLGARLLVKASEASNERGMLMGWERRTAALSPFGTCPLRGAACLGVIRLEFLLVLW